jgi:hypothetical protein
VFPKRVFYLGLTGFYLFNRFRGVLLGDTKNDWSLLIAYSLTNSFKSFYFLLRIFYSYFLMTLIRFWSSCSFDSRILFAFNDGNLYLLDFVHVWNLVLAEFTERVIEGDFGIANSMSGKVGIAFFIRTKKHL